MAPSPAQLLKSRPVQWMIVWEVGKEVYANGRDRLGENLTKRERDELRDLIGKSKGLPTKLTSRQRTRFTRLTKKAVTGDADAGWLAFSRSAVTLVPPRVATSLLNRRAKRP